MNGYAKGLLVGGAWLLLSGQAVDPCGCAASPPGPCCQVPADDPRRQACLAAEANRNDAGPPEACPVEVEAQQDVFHGGRMVHDLSPEEVLVLVAQYDAFHADGWANVAVRQIFNLALGEGWRFVHMGSGQTHIWSDPERAPDDLYCYRGDTQGAPVPWQPVAGEIPPPGFVERPGNGRLIVRPDDGGRILWTACMPLESGGWNVWTLVAAWQIGPGVQHLTPILHVFQDVFLVQGAGVAVDVRVRKVPVSPMWATGPRTNGAGTMFWWNADVWRGERNRPVAGQPCPRN